MTYKIILKYINYENNCWINNLEQCMKLLTVNIYKGIKNINKKKRTIQSTKWCLHQFNLHVFFYLFIKLVKVGALCFLPIIKAFLPNMLKKILKFLTLHMLVKLISNRTLIFCDVKTGGILFVNSSSVSAKCVDCNCSQSSKSRAVTHWSPRSDACLYCACAKNQNKLSTF